VLVVVVVVPVLSLPCRAALPPAVPMVQVHACQLLGVVVMVVVWSVVCIEVYVLGWSVVCPWCTLLYTVEHRSSPPAGHTTGETR
jgi:hypothetical protein